MSNFTKEEVKEIIRQCFYHSSTMFTGNSICLKDEDIVSSHPHQECLYSSLIGRALTILEIALTGKQLEAAKSQMREVFGETVKDYRESYEYVGKTILENKTQGCGEFGGILKELLHK